MISHTEMVKLIRSELKQEDVTPNFIAVILREFLLATPATSVANRKQIRSFLVTAKITALRLELE